MSALRHVLERHATQALHLLHSLKPSGNTLDLVITNEEYSINEILYQPGLGLSHHVCLQFIQVYLLCWWRSVLDQPQDLIFVNLILASLIVYLTQLNGMRL